MPAFIPDRLSVFGRYVFLVSLLSSLILFSLNKGNFSAKHIYYILLILISVYFIIITEKRVILLGLLVIAAYLSLRQFINSR